MRTMSCGACGSLLLLQVVHVGKGAPQGLKDGDPDWLLYCPACSSAEPSSEQAMPEGTGGVPMKYDPVRAMRFGRMSILLAAQALCGSQPNMKPQERYDLGNLLFEWLACTSETAGEDVRGWSAYVQGIPLDEVEEDGRLAFVTARVRLGNSPEQLGPFYFAETENGDIGVWMGRPRFGPKTENWRCLGAGASATEALQDLAKGRQYHQAWRQDGSRSAHGDPLRSPDKYRR